jgi:hypothetical protein
MPEQQFFPIKIHHRLVPYARKQRKYFSGHPGNTVADFLKA